MFSCDSIQPTYVLPGFVVFVKGLDFIHCKFILVSLYLGEHFKVIYSLIFVKVSKDPRFCFLYDLHSNFSK